MYDKFEQWLDEALAADLPENAVALNFNLYEDGDNWWSVELVATDRFDADDPDWACDEVFDTRENPYEWEEDSPWLDILEKACGWVREYMANGYHAEKISTYTAVGCGFVDGDIELLYIKE